MKILLIVTVMNDNGYNKICVYKKSEQTTQCDIFLNAPTF